MGHKIICAVIASLSLWANAAHAEAAPTHVKVIEESWSLRPAVGTDMFVSTDADKTEVVKAGVDLDARYISPEEYLGIRLEKAWYKPLGKRSTDFERVYLRYADKSGGWAWQAQVGTDGHTLLGTATIHDNAKYRKEFFVERDIVETQQGVKRGIYYTFAGAALDLPVNDRNSFTFVGGGQKFTGDNLRLHARANFVHVVKPSWGLSVQLRTRYFHDTKPGEFDYFSPRWYAQILPVLQLRRYSGGWRYLIAGGFGAQRSTGVRWRSSRYANVQVTSPAIARKLYLKAAFVYTNTPVGSGYVYSYQQFTFGITRAF